MSSVGGDGFVLADLAKMIDHSLLNPTLTPEDLESGLKLAVEEGVASVCIMPYALARCAEVLRGTGVRASTTIGFPHGGHTTAAKAFEARKALEDGGEELDVVINISKALGGDWAYVGAEIRELTAITQSAGARIKVIFENCYLTDAQKIKLCEICGEAGADWVKTSTGYGTGGATDADLILMRRHSPARVQVKAAGGIRDLDGLLRVRSLGVTRVGASRTRDILNEARRRLGLAETGTGAGSSSGSGSVGGY